MTVMATDVNRLRELSNNFHSSWSAPLTVLIAIALAWRLLGVAILPGIGVLCIVIPVNARSSRMFSKVNDDLMAQQQQRMQRLSEILEGILVVKLFSWEHTMATRVSDVRDRELTFVKKYSYGIATIMTVIWSASTLMAVASFAAYAAMGKTLTPEIVFPTLYLYDMMTFPMIQFPYVVSTLASTVTSFKRIQVRDHCP